MPKTISPNWYKKVVKRRTLGPDKYRMLVGETNWFNQLNVNRRVTVHKSNFPAHKSVKGKIMALPWHFVVHSRGTTTQHQYFRLKSEAVKKAKSYMKNHPRG